MKPYCTVNKHDSQIGHFDLCREGIVWKVLEKGIPVNLAETHEPCNSQQAMPEETNIQAIVPLWYVDQMTQEERTVGALIIDSNGAGGPIPAGDFEYLKLLGELIGGAVGKVELSEQIIESCRKKEAIVKETAHAFRNRMTTIGGFSQRIARFAKGTGLAKEAGVLYNEIQSLESDVERFEKCGDIKAERDGSLK